MAQCDSRDTRLIDCTIDKTEINGCEHSEDAGVICLGKKDQYIHSPPKQKLSLQVPATALMVL